MKLENGKANVPHFSDHIPILKFDLRPVIYFKFSLRRNNGQLDAYYRLVESYNEASRVCHRTILLETKSKRQVRFKSVKGKGDETDYYLEVACQDKFATEESMRRQFEERFEGESLKISGAPDRKGGIKKIDKVHQRIGQAREKYPSVQYYYDI